MRIGLGLLVVVLLASCGGDGKGTGGNGIEGGGRAVAFACEADTCQAGSQYCLISKVGNGTAVRACEPLPLSCQDCDCALKDLDRVFPHTNNCGLGATVGCAWTRNNDEARQITVTCTRPRI